MVSKLPLSPNIFTESKIASYYNNNVVSKDLNFQLLETSREKISSILKGLNPSKAAGIDNLSGKFLKDDAHVLARPISQLCNLSIKLNSFPRSCKIAKVKPLFKRGSKMDPQNYRPISLLPLLSKIIERIVHDQTEEFLSKNKLLYRLQSGFRKNYSTNTCLGHLTDKITTGFENGLFTGMILIDLQKALDTIDHQILLKKMKYLGFSKNTITWFKSYLCARKFKISINTSYSSSNLLCGTPQGSILGPLFFLLYINDLPQAVVSNSLLYADDNCIVFQHKSEIEIEKQLIRDCSSLCDLFVDNKLSIPFQQDKTKSILFGTKQKLRNAKSLNIVYNGIEIKQNAKVKYLGSILDETLSGESMALNIIDKINSCLKFLHRQNRFLTPPLCRLLCNALIQPLFDYACIAWFPNLSKKLRLRLQATQNKCIRFCLQQGKMSRICVNEFLELNWLNVQDRYLQFIVSDIFKFYNNQCPDYFNEVFCPVNYNGVAMRSSTKKLKLPSRKSKLGTQSLSYVGPSTWNKLPNNLKTASSVNCFKHNIKKYFLKKLGETEVDIYSYA